MVFPFEGCRSPVPREGAALAPLGGGLTGCEDAMFVLLVWCWHGSWRGVFVKYAGVGVYVCVCGSGSGR
jgi:hypothetical protein